MSRRGTRREVERAKREEGPALILVDSSGWIEYLTDGALADRYAPYIEGRERMIVSAIEVYEVYRVIRRDISEERAVEAVSALRGSTIVPVDDSLALEAADTSIDLGLAMADSIVYATARRHRATLVTGDSDFEGLSDVVVIN